MNVKLLTRYLLSSALLVGWNIFLQPGEEVAAKSLFYQYSGSDTILKADTLHLNDSILILADTVIIDTTSQKSENILEAQVKCNARDSLHYDLRNRKAFLYGEAEVYYKDLSLKADYIEVDFAKNEVFAKGMPDSTGTIAGNPVFTEGDQSFNAKTMRYNFKSKKGFITGVLTQDGFGYLQGKTVKKMADDNLNISGGYYTTCDNKDHPHFEFRYNKSRVVPGKRIVTGPAYLVIEGMPTPLGIPFGWFPSEQGKRNGIIIPTYGESDNRGFYFENMGYYFGVGEHFDMHILGDIYTRGSWAVKPSLRYKWRYKFDGNFNFSYAVNILGEPETSGYSRNKDFAVRWLHKQDKAARPNSTFTADVNIKSSQYNRFNPTSQQDYLSNTFRSSVAYQTNFAGKYFLTMNAGVEQNTLAHTVNVSLPEINFSANRFNPFKSKKKSGPLKWYDNITASYTMKAINKLSGVDSLFFDQSTLENAKNGIQHSIPISSPLKLLKFINMTNSININDRMYFATYKKGYSPDTLFVGNDTIVGYETTDTIPGFANAFDFSLSSSLSTKLYGMFQFGSKFPIRAIRHVLTPTASFTYVPDFGKENWGYYDSYVGPEGEEEIYSVFGTPVYGIPPANNSGRVSFSLANNLEMKVRARKDTITGMKKIVLIENFTIGGYYDLVRDSLNLSKITMSGRTTLFKNLTLQYRSLWDPYIVDSTGNKNLDQFEWKVNKRLLRMDNTNWSVSLTWHLTSKDFEKKKETDRGTEMEREEIRMSPDQYIDWSVPWDFTVSYTFNHTTRYRYPQYNKTVEKTLVQTLGVSGNVSLTPKWKVGVSTGWDFESSDLSYTSLSIYRDLHCWEMRFNWIPTGFQKSWNFSINAKASILQDLKLTKKKDFRDF